jgi:NAD(P)-dependent dehydrogenase (short-subunit alcohol dehydrogenase family)
MNRRIWIVGGSSGIGLELVKDGERVVVSSRNASRSNELATLEVIYEEHLKIVDLDAASEDSIEQAVKKAWDAFDGIDLWFYNAGAYEVMDINTWDYERFEQMTRVNYLGAVRIMTALMPLFKRTGRGRWVWNASMASYIGLPLGGGYSAPKAALVNLAESLQPELLQYGIELQIINHGFVKTRLTAKNSFEMPQLMEPSEAAEHIFTALKEPYSFEVRFPFALGFFLRLLRMLPYRISLALTKKALP